MFDLDYFLYDLFLSNAHSSNLSGLNRVKKLPKLEKTMV